LLKAGIFNATENRFAERERMERILRGEIDVDQVEMS